MNVTTPARFGKVTDERLLAAAGEAANMRQLLLALGVAPYGGNYEFVRRRLEALGVREARFLPRPPRRRPTEDELAHAVRVADSFAQVARLLHLGADAQRQVKRLVEAAGLDHSHFLGKASNRGVRVGGRKPPPLDEVLVRGRHCSTDGLRRRLLRAGLLPPRCGCCGLERWQGRAIPLELDHVNGDRLDNRLSNLRMLCPNCHAQTETYRGRNIGGGAASVTRVGRGEREVTAAQERARLSEERLMRLMPAPA